MEPRGFRIILAEGGIQELQKWITITDQLEAIL